MTAQQTTQPQTFDLAQRAQQLIDAHSRKNHHLKGLIGATARDHYKRGVSDLLDVLQHQAVDEELVRQLMQPEPKTAPLAVQPTHAAQDNPLGVPTRVAEEAL